MKLAARTNDLSAAVTEAARAVTSKTVLPAIANIHFDATGPEVLLTATDLDTTVRVRLKAEIAEPGQRLIEGKTLASIARALPRDRAVLLEAPDGPAVLECGVSRYKINAMDASEFPPMPEVKGDLWAIDAEAFNAMAGRAARCTYGTEDRPTIMGVLLEARQDGIGMVATNGHHLCRAATNSTGPSGTLANAILPTSVLDVAARMEGEIDVTIDGGFVVLESATVRVVSRLIGGSYPNYKQVIPKDNDKAAVVDKRQLVEAVKRAAIVASGEDTPKIVLTFAGDTLTLTTGRDTQKGREEVTLTEHNGTDGFEIGFNVSYLNDILPHVPTDQVKLTFKTPERASIIKPVGEHDFSECFWLLMPLRVRD